MSEKVVIGMSGGVDSSVAAALLKKQGYEVIGVTMRLWDGEHIDGEFTEGSCCSLSAVEDARRVAYKLGIDYYVMDFRTEFEKNVIDYFVDEYQCGRTPNPCIACNKFLKFDALLKKAEMLGASYVATGHYARIEYDENLKRYLLKKSKASAKDQTYALYGLNQVQLSKTLMPLGELTGKDETRRLADELGLPTANKPDSQEICFVPDNDYADFIYRRTGNELQPGNFVDSDGNILGRHQGIVKYTIGQRKGLGITFGKPMFVIRIDAEKNEVILGEKGTEFSESLIAEKLNFIMFDKPKNEFRAKVKVRYTAKEALATVIPLNDERVKVVFDDMQRAVTPGQAVVFYEIDGDNVIGGGIISGN